jgi:hypothetical protein
MVWDRLGRPRAAIIESSLASSSAGRLMLRRARLETVEDGMGAGETDYYERRWG